MAVITKLDPLFECTTVFLENWKSKKKVNVNQGGTSSTKTYSIVQCMYQHARHEPGVICTITSEDIPALKKGAYRDAEIIYKNSPTLKREIESWNKTDRIIQFKNGSLIEFTSSDSVIDAQQGKRDYLFLNEANSVDYLIYWQLAIRTRKKIYLDYNPSAPFWVHDNLLSSPMPPNVKYIQSDHRCNPYLSDEQHFEIENIKDPELHRVYARGETGNLTGIIYPDWQIIEDADYNEIKRTHDKGFFGGVDFGYTNDPTAGVQIIRQGDTLYIHELFYETGIPPQTIVNHFKAAGWGGPKYPLYCEHDKYMTSEIRRLQLLALPALKGQGSVLAGILKMREFKVYVTRSSKNIWNERKRYVWLNDPSTGKPINEPIDKWNHLMDAIRYAVYTHYFKS